MFMKDNLSDMSQVMLFFTIVLVMIGYFPRRCQEEPPKTCTEVLSLPQGEEYKYSLGRSLREKVDAYLCVAKYRMQPHGLVYMREDIANKGEESVDILVKRMNEEIGNPYMQWRILSLLSYMKTKETYFFGGNNHLMHEVERILNRTKGKIEGSAGGAESYLNMCFNILNDLRK